MKTLRAACDELSVTYKTLEKWMGRLKIKPDRHPRDLRFFVIEDEDIERIRTARAEMPGALSDGQRVIHAPLTPLAVPILSEQPQPQQPESPYSASKATGLPKRGLLYRLEPLPDDWVAFNTEFCAGHGDIFPVSLMRDPLFPRPHVRETPDEQWRGHGEHPRPVKSAYDLEQHLEAARLAHQRWPEKFKPCRLCRHLFD